MPVRIQKGRVLDALNLTPLIDVVFLLLIFFLVATTFQEESLVMDVVLPEASEAKPLISRPRELVVNVDQVGRWHMHGRELGEAELLAALQQAETNNPGRQTVLIRADKRCRWEYVVGVMNLCNRAQIRDYRVSTAANTDTTTTPSK
ncbi:MAG: biopolymer transporter ExbD [Pirellulales bacterium]|nr:biopolymer transporter ExbD [Pirellulales bacterium]